MQLGSLHIKLVAKRVCIIDNLNCMHNLKQTDKWIFPLRLHLSGKYFRELIEITTHISPILSLLIKISNSMQQIM
jgi:hypothetical protein